MTTNELITANAQTIIDGKYNLGAVIRRSVHSTVYETQVEDGGRTRLAVLKMRELDRESSESKVTQWRDAMQLQHPNLLRLYAAGTEDLEGGVSVEYVVMERADESLAGVLNERALSEGEVLEMLGPMVEALRYLHKKGYAHGALKPSNVMAGSDELKLSTDSCLRVTEGGSLPEDMQALGALISDALGAGDPPQYFLNLIQHCRDADVSKRWTVDELAEYLSAPPKETRIEPKTEIVRRPANRRSRKTPVWVFAGLALVVLVVLAAAALRNKESAPAPVTPAPVVSAAPVQSPLAPSAQSPVARAVTPKIVRATPAAPTAALIPHRKGRRDDGWSVIVAAYGSRDAAEKRMRTLAGKWPAFHPTVLEQRTEKAPFVVVLGDNLSEDGAQALRQRAVNAGLPRDTYIKRLM